MRTIEEIEVLTKKFADARLALGDAVSDLNLRIESLKREALPKLRTLSARAKEREQDLHNAVEESAGLFQKPRTVIFHGIKIGFVKGIGRIEWDDEERTIKLIKRHLPDQADSLIKTKEYVLKGALKGLTVQQLKLIGCEVEESGDQVVIRVTDKDIDKLVNALLKGMEMEAEVA